MAQLDAAHSHHDYAKTRKEYLKVFLYLCILTVVEVGVVFLKHVHVPELIIARRRRLPHQTLQPPRSGGPGQNGAAPQQRPSRREWCRCG